MANSDDGSEEDEYWQNYRYSAAFRRASFHPPDEVWTLFSEAEDCCEIIDYFKALTKVTNIDPNLKGIKFYEVLKSKLTSWKCQSLWDLLNARLKHREYQNGTVCKDLNCLIIGAGPIGLRTAIEFLFLGCSRVTIVEQRTEFSRNNVLHLWPFLLTDFKALGAKKFYGKFGAGCIDHINIRTLQCILLKVALVLGCDIHIGVTFKKMVEPRDKNVGWTVHLEPENLSISKVPFDVVIGADGKKNVLPGFPQIELRGALAIGITCNFVNNNTIEEARVPEISGVSYQFNPTFFKDMEAQYGVKLENIVYYKNETHYFVMTALKSSLLNLGVLKQEVSDPRRLLESSNIDKDKLVKFTLSAVNFATDHQLPKVEFKKLSNGKPDIALFDFTSIKKAANASRIIERQNKKLLLALVGDSLIEPFWPTGSGCGRGVLSALDVAWMVRQFALKHPPLSVLRERENVFKLLSGTNNDSLQKSYKSFTIDPKSRYKGFDTKRVSNMTSLKGLYDTDDPDHADFTVISPMPSNEPSPVKKTAAQRRRSSSGSSRKVTSTHLHPHLTSTLSSGKKKRSDKTKDQQTVGSTKAFWEEHNKKNYEEKAKSHVTKKRSATLSGDIDDIEEAEEALSDLEDDVIVDELTDNNNFKRGPVPLASNNTKETKKNDKIKYQAKGGGLRARREASKKTPEKPTTTEVKSRRRSTGSKKNLHRRKVTKSESEDIPPKKENKASVKKEESKRLVDSRSFFKKWVEDLTAKYKAFSSSNEPNGALDICTRNAIMSLAAVPLLMDCNRPPPRRTTDIKLKDINKAKESFLNQTNNRLETKEISVKRAGSVKNTVAKYKMLVKEEEKKDDYYEFIRRTSLKTKLMKSDEEIDETDRALPECEPREVIDVEKALLSQDEEEERRSRLSKSSWNGPLSQTSNIELNLALLEFCDYQTPLNSIYMLQVLYNVHRRILDAPTIDKYYRIYVKGNIFERYVWLLEGSEDFMNKAGWVKCGNYLVLSKSYPVKQSISVIEDVLKRKKKAQIIYSGSVQNQTRKGDVSVRRAKSSVNTKIDENEVLSTYANIDSPTRLHESDSAFGSGFEDNDEPFPPENRKLRRVESRERVVGNEQYVVVDFVGNLEFKSVVKRPSDDESPDSTALSVSPTMSVHSAFEEISTSDFNSPDSPSSVSIATESDDRLEIPAAKSKKIAAPVEESDIVETVERATEEAPSFEKLSSLEEPRENEIEAQPKYRATKGLKQAKQEKAKEKLETESDKENIKVAVPDTRPSPTFGNRARRSDSSASNSSVSSYTSSRKTSLRSNASDAGTKSIVMQNKLLFDKQIAEENKRKYGSMTSLDSKPKKLDTSLFERNNSLRNSFSKSQQQMEGSDDIRISGIVAGTREMFENDKSRSVTGLSYRKRDNDVIRKESFKRNNEEISTYVKTTNDANDEIIATIANKESVTSGSLKKKKKGIFKKKRKTESKYSPNKNTEEIENLKDNTENNPQDDDHNKKGFFARIRKRSKSQESDSKASKQNSIEIEIPTENEVVFDDTTSEMTSPRFDDISVTHDDFNNDIKVSADLENNVSVTEDSSEKSYAVSVQNDSTTLEMRADNILENHNDDANFLEDDHEVMVETGLQNDLQAIANRQSSSKSKKKNVFKKKKKSKSEKNEDLLEGKLDTNISPVITVENESSIDQNNDIVSDNDVAYNANHDIQADISLPTIDEKAVHESDITMDEELPNTQFTVKSEDIDKNFDDRDLASIDANIDTTADLGRADISLSRDVDNENQNNHDSTINVTTPTNNIGELVFERPTGANSEKDSSLVLPQISITDEDHVANSNDNIPINDDGKRSSLEGSDDELVRALDLANKIPSAIDDDTTSYTSYASSVTSTKKKKKFPFHLKGSSKKEKKEKKEANGDPKNLSVKSSKKNKRPKSLDLSNTDLSLSSSNLDISSIDSPEKSKKKRMGLFRSKKKKNGSTDSPTKLSPEKAKPFPNSHAENTASQHTLLSSDEFTIPENNLVESDVSANISVDLRKSDANEYSKQSSLIEIQRSEEMEF